MSSVYKSELIRFLVSEITRHITEGELLNRLGKKGLLSDDFDKIINGDDGIDDSPIEVKETDSDGDIEIGDGDIEIGDGDDNKDKDIEIEINDDNGSEVAGGSDEMVEKITEEFGGIGPLAVNSDYIKDKIGMSKYKKVEEMCDGSDMCVAKHAGLMDLVKHDKPKNDESWLNNDQIDDTMRLYCIKYPNFYACPYSMSDVYNCNLGKINMLDVIDGKQSFMGAMRNIEPRKCDLFACIVNTDTTSGKGIHWFVLFVDCRKDKKIVGYFNSVKGQAPMGDVPKWMDKTVSDLKGRYEKVEKLLINRVAHQQFGNQCGMYSLYFVATLLLGVDIEYWLNSKERIYDEEATKLRNVLFTVKGG
jgi:hypothetical protein